MGVRFGREPKRLYSGLLWGVRFGNNRVVGAEVRSSVGPRTEVCGRKDGYSLDDNLCYNVGMIRVYWAQEMLSMAQGAA